MKGLLDRILGVFRPAPAPLPPIDQSSYWDMLESTRKRLTALEAECEREKVRITSAVLSWASETVSERRRASFNPRVVGRDIAAWLPGLNTTEIRIIAAVSAFDLRHHLFENHILAGVRVVQPLEECVLIWPKPVLNPEQQRAGASGGPRYR